MISYLKFAAVSALTFFLAACQHTAEDDWDVYDTWRVFENISERAGQ